MNGFGLRWVAGWLEGLGQVTLLAKEVAGSILCGRLTGRDLIYQLYFIGVKSQSVVIITGAFTGLLAVVSCSVARELGPVLTGLMVAGRVGAALAAELGTMRVTEQIDALRTLASHPVDYLVVPRLLATAMALPLLTGESITIGIAAGFALCTSFLGIDPAYTWHNMIKYTDVQNVEMGLIKALIYGGIIGLISCYKGLTCREGAEGVGRATTEAGVSSSITILITNFFLTLCLNRVLWPS